MTDLNERFAAMLDGEPTAPHDLDRVVAAGRRSLRRRHALTAVAGTAGTAAVTAAIVVPIAINGTGGSGGGITVGTKPTPVVQPHCKLYFDKAQSTAGVKRNVAQLRKKVERRANANGTTVNIKAYALKPGLVQVTVCPPGASPAPGPGKTAGVVSPATSDVVPYTYSEDPATIASRLGHELTQQVTALGLSIIYTSPFAQESSTLEKGHPAYFGGSVDVQLPNGPANVGVQVTHKGTGPVPFDGSCDAPDCTQTTLSDGSVLQVSHISAGSGGAEVIAVEIHHTDGLVVEAQEANYGFGPEATRARSSQPLTIDQLTTLAEDAAFTF